MRYKIMIDPRLKMPEEIYSKTWDIPRYISISGAINEENAKKFRDELSIAEDAAYYSKQEVIPVTIDTQGGCIYSLISMMDAIKNCSVPVATIIEAKAFSAAATLFSCGAEGHRYISPNATLMIHSVGLGHVGGKADEVKATTDELHRLNEKVHKMMSNNCGHEDNYFLDIVRKRHVDWYLEPEEAVKHNLANHVHVPSFDIKVEISHTFK